MLNLISWEFFFYQVKAGKPSKVAAQADDSDDDDDDDDDDEDESDSGMTF